VRLARPLLLALWAGLLVSVGGVVAPLLFHVLPDRHLAGALAGELFRAATVLSALVAALLTALDWRASPRAARSFGVLWPALLLSASEWGVRPLLEAARVAGATGAFGAWHALASLCYWVATGGVIAAFVAEWRRAGAPR